MGIGNGAGSKATQFKPKHPGRAAAQPPRPAAGARPSRLLRDMRFVYQHDEDRDRTNGHYNCRRWLDQDVRGFIATLARLEAALAAGLAPAPPGA